MTGEHDNIVKEEGGWRLKGPGDAKPDEVKQPDTVTIQSLRDEIEKLKQERQGQSTVNQVKEVAKQNSEKSDLDTFLEGSKDYLSKHWRTILLGALVYRKIKRVIRDSTDPKE